MNDAVVHAGDCRDWLPTFAEGGADCVVTDPPYETGFMGARWDGTGVAFEPATWRAVLRVLKPGGYLLAFGGSRTVHRLTCAVEDAGFEVRDQILYMFGTGFPKGKGCLKPAYEPIVLARRPAPRVLPLGIDECRVPTGDDTGRTRNTALGRMNDDAWRPGRQESESHPAGRYPANVVHDGSDEVLEAFAAFGESRSAKRSPATCGGKQGNKVYADLGDRKYDANTYSDSGTAARFFYTAKASKAERGEDNAHPCVKPQALLRWLVRLACPPGGLVLDPFAGSGSAGVAALAEGRRYAGCELDAHHAETARRRIAARSVPASSSPPSLFDGLE